MNQLRNRHFFNLDLLLIPFTVYLSYVLRLEVFDLGHNWASFLLYTTLAIVIVPATFFVSGVYRRFWRYASVGEMMLLSSALLFATVATSILAFVIPIGIDNLFRPPRSIPLLFLVLGATLLGGIRLLVRLQANYHIRKGRASGSIPTLIIGAGDAGTMMLRELQQNPQLGLDVVGFVDDDPAKHGVTIHGTRVLGAGPDIPGLVEQFRVVQAIIAMPTAPGQVIRTMVTLCETAGIHPRIIPGIYELLDGTVSVNQLREVNIEDLLRRDPVRINPRMIARLMRGQRVLVTGAGGSIGSELCRQIAAFDPSEILLLDHGENSLFFIHNELKRRFPTIRFDPIICDIRNRERLTHVIGTARPAVIFHAAAHKHVPMMEANPCEAITNNVRGTRNLVELAAQFDVHHFVMISTDKAVNPTSIMGASKRVAERIVHSVAQEEKRAYVAVRFGNVLGSNGSVVPLFKQQIAAGGPVTVTHPDMKRFFMTIPEAVQLVLQAAALGRGGEVFVLDMGEPVKIIDLARDLIRLSGLRPDEDIEIRITGPRPGEKLFEELFIDGENYQRTRHEKIFVAQNASEHSENGVLRRMVDDLLKVASDNEVENVRLALKAIVPEYSPERQHLSPAEPEAVAAPGAPLQPVPSLRQLDTAGEST